MAKALIEKTTIGQIAKHIKEVYKPNMACIEVLLDMDAINKLHLKVNTTTITTRQAGRQAGTPADRHAAAAAATGGQLQCA